jgi:hypothetical protein
MREKLLVLVALCLGVSGCDGGEARADTTGAGRVVDSLLPREEALRRFRDGLPLSDSLAGGASSRDELVQAFVRALSTSDTAGLARMAVSRSEFAYLYYPTSPRGKPPYDLEPGVMWFLQVQHSDRGLTRALKFYGGKPMALLGYDCGDRASREGENVVHGPCSLRWRDPDGHTAAVRLFSQILERDGRFKFLSYANRLD